MPTDARPLPLEPHDIAAVESSYRTETVNQYLNCGWVITAIARQQSGPDDVSVVYHLGWQRALGEPKIPDAVQKSRDDLDEWIHSSTNSTETQGNSVGPTYGTVPATGSS